MMIKILNLFLFNLLFVQTTVFACTVCFSTNADDPQVKGVQGGILALILVLLFIFALFIKFFLGFAKRAKELSS